LNTKIDVSGIRKKFYNNKKKCKFTTEIFMASNQQNYGTVCVFTYPAANQKADDVRTVETQCIASLQRPIPPTTSYITNENKFGSQSKNLASIMRGFKIAVTTYARKHHIDFAWQERFHDRIIRDNNGLENVRSYIFNNPQNWNEDEFNEESPKWEGV